MEAVGRHGKSTTRAVAIGVAFVASLGVVVAFDYILDDFLLYYPNTTLDVYTDFVTGDDCVVCHVLSDEADPGNAYKEDLKANGYDISALDFIDSDGDGVDNQTEANALRVDPPTVVAGQTQVGYNLGLIDCPDGRLGYDPFSMQVITGVHETPPEGTVWQNEDPDVNCNDGLDNDCDGLKDAADPDCSPPPGCTFDADCDDGLFCNGRETCDASRQCQPGSAVNCDDGVGCTADSCNEVADTCVNSADDAACSDGLFCNGAETCDPLLDCQAGTPVDCNDAVGCTTDSCDEVGDACVNTPDDSPCDDGLFCNGAEQCDRLSDCQAGVPVDCGDGVGCTSDVCDETADRCVNTPDDAACSDGLFCTGAERCDPLSDCQAGAPVDCGDGVGCTSDVCDETADRCVNTPDHAACDDGVFCNGAERCDPTSDCQTSPAVNCDDGQLCTDDSCNERDDLCDNVFDPTNDPICAEATCGNSNVEAGEECDDGNTVDGDCCSANCTLEPAGSACDDGLFCNTGEVCDGAGMCGGGTPTNCDDGVGCTRDSCDETADTCVHAPDDAVCSDGLFCNGAETCDPVGDCTAGLPVNCDDAVGCTADSCDEAADRCVNAPDDSACDDGLFCNGSETCDSSLDCRGGAPVVCDDGVACTVDSCDEAADVCTQTPNDAACDDGDICTDDSCDPGGGCASVLDPTNDPQCEPVCTDQDGDGYFAEGGACGSPDCNDAIPAINPAAEEICDGLDNDCDGGIDEGLPFRTWYRDADGDGFGDPGQSQRSCSNVPPGGYVSDDTDCDDGQAAVFPGAPEICRDGLDNDCDGLQDEAVCDDYDSNGDRVVDGRDLAWLGRAFGLCSANPSVEWWYSVDHDKNGCVDGEDLALLSSAWYCRGGVNLCN